MYVCIFYVCMHIMLYLLYPYDICLFHFVITTCFAVVAVSNLACGLYNRRLYDQAFTLVEILCRDLCKNCPVSLSVDRVTSLSVFVCYAPHKYTLYIVSFETGICPLTSQILNGFCQIRDA